MSGLPAARIPLILVAAVGGPVLVTILGAAWALRAPAADAQAALVAVALAGALAAALSATLLAVTIARRLRRTTGILQRLVAEEAAPAIADTDRRDGLGDLARGLAAAGETLAELRQQLAAAEADRRARQRRQEEADQLTGLFGRSIAGVFQRMGDSCETMRLTAMELEAGAASTASEAVDIRVATNGTQAGIRSIADSVQDLAQAMRRVGGQATQIEGLARSCAEGMRGAETVADSLSDSTRRISDVVRIIAAVAGRTNLLALNATIEAARAGELGKGFAVVASEVKQLATQTAQATEEINTQIAAVHGAVDRAVLAIRAVANPIASVGEGSAALAAAVDEQGAAVARINEAAEALLASTSRVADGVDMLDATARDADAGATAMATRADSVSQEAMMVAREVTEFVDALGTTAETDRFQACLAGIDGELEAADGRAVPVRIARLTSGSVAIGPGLAARPGEPFTLHIRGLARPVQVRFAGADDTASHLQLPMDLEHVEWMDSEIRRLGLREAA